MGSADAYIYFRAQGGRGTLIVDGGGEAFGFDVHFVFDPKAEDQAYSQDSTADEIMSFKTIG
jgi:hypothetical protein